MADAEDAPGREADELTAMIRAIQERVRVRHPDGAAGPFPVALADLMPVVRARDAAEVKVAAIGSVNPRPPGLLNNLIQRTKRLVARSLDWHVREQIEFNRGVMGCVESLLAALDENNRALAALAGEFAGRLETRVNAAATQLHRDMDQEFGALRGEVESVRGEMESVRGDLVATRRALDELREQAALLLDEARQLKDVRKHWAEWRVDWERKLSINEVQFLRTAADLQTGFQHRVTLLESNLRELVSSQHAAFNAALDRSVGEVQKRLWTDLEKVRLDYEQLIHNELRLVRQRAGLLQAPSAAPPAVPAAPAALRIDYLQFANKFRGPEEYVRERQRFYLPFFRDCRNALDVGCGRGEFLEVMKEAGLAARGIDLSAESVALCRSKGLEAEVADLFTYLDGLADQSLDGIFCAQVVEHLPPERLPDFIRLAAAKLRRGGVLAVETPNPECLAIFSTHFYLDPTHTRPIPPPLLTFYMVECGFGLVEVHKFAPAAESLPVVQELTDQFREAFFGALDYAAVGRKLS